MCLGIPGQVVQTYVADNLPMGKVDFGGVSQRVCLAYTPGVQAGQYVLVHAGFALQVIDEAEAQKTFALLWEMSQLDGLSLAAEERTAAGGDGPGEKLAPRDRGSA